MDKNTGECKKLHKRDTEGREKRGGHWGREGWRSKFQKNGKFARNNSENAFFCQGNSAFHTSGLLSTMPILDDLIKIILFKWT